MAHLLSNLDTGRHRTAGRLAPIFYRLRPVIETGWEMPVLIRALLLGISEEKILLDWQTIAPQLLLEEGLQPCRHRHETRSAAGWMDRH